MDVVAGELAFRSEAPFTPGTKAVTIDDRRDAAGDGYQRVLIDLYDFSTGDPVPMGQSLSTDVDTSGDFDLTASHFIL